MQELLKAILEDKSVRVPGAAAVAASNAVNEFTPWGSGEVGE